MTTTRDPEDGSWSLDRVRPRAVRWLWPDRIARGKVTILDGDPGLGKSTILGADLAARVSTGADLPDGSPGSGQPATVLLASAEDDPADTIVPRILAAGGNPRRVRMVRLREPGGGDPFAGVLPTAEDDPDRGTRSMTLPGDLPALARMVMRHAVALVVIDPVVAYLAPEVDSHRDQDVRRVLATLAEIAGRSGAAIVAIRHLNKATGTSVMYRGGGSIGITAAARIGLVVATDPDDATRTIMSVYKSNAGPTPASLAYHIVPAIVYTDDAAPIPTSRIEWLGPVSIGAHDLMARQAGEGADRTALDEAVEWLRDYLADGPRPAVDVRRDCARDGHAFRTVERAKVALGVRSRRPDGFTGPWVWALPYPATDLGTPPSPSTRGNGAEYAEGGGVPEVRNGHQGAPGEVAERFLWSIGEDDE